MAAAIVQPLTRPRVGMLAASPDSQFAAVALKKPVGTTNRTTQWKPGAQALAKLGECDCDCVILELRLPDLDASEVAGFLRQRYARTAIEMVGCRGYTAE